MSVEQHAPVASRRTKVLIKAIALACALTVLAPTGPSIEPAAAAKPRTILFHVGRKIFTMRPDGTGKKLVRSQNWGTIWNTRWSANGMDILYDWRDRYGETGTTWIDRHGVVKDALPGSVEFSPDMKKYAYFDGEDGVRVIAADSGAPVGTGYGGPGPMSWTPDSAILFYSTFWVGHVQIYRMNANGADMRSLTTDGGYAPQVSPDGTKVAFISTRDMEGHEEDAALSSAIYTMNLDGSDQQKITSQDNLHHGDIRWSPDSSRIAYTTWKDPSLGGASNLEILVVNADGSGRVNVTKTPKRHEDGPRWSPDSRRLVFDSWPKGKPKAKTRDIFTVLRNGTGKRNLTGSIPAASNPDWRPF